MKRAITTILFLCLTIIGFSKDKIPANYTGVYTTFHQNGNVESQGKYENGKQEGDLFYYKSNGNMRRKVGYHNGIQTEPPNDFLSSARVKDKNPELEKLPGEWIKCIVYGKTDTVSKFTLPTFPGGFSEYKRFLNANIHYPEKERDAAISGFVHVLFIVEPDGSLSNISIDKGVENGLGLELEAMRLVKIMPRWVPGKENGNTIKVAVILPFTFFTE